MKPGVSAAMTGVLPMRRARSAVADDTAGSVSGPAITSTSAMTGTGLKKCIPTTRCGRSVASAILVIDRLLVLLARMTSRSAAAASRRRNAPRLSSRSSGAASITRSAEARSSNSVAVASRPSAAPPSAGVSWPFSTRRPMNPAIRSFARSTAPATGSWMSTARPASAATWAIPAPIVPAPSTPTRAIVSGATGSPDDVSGSATNEARLPLLSEGADPPGMVIGASGELLQRRLPGEALRQERILRVVDGTLGVSDRRGRCRGQSCRRLPRCGGEFRGRNDSVHQAGGLRLSGAERLAAEDELRRAVAAQGADQDPRRTRVRHQADAHEGLDEARLLGRVDQVARQRQRHTRACGNSVDRRDHRLRQVANGRHQRVVLIGQDTAEVALADAAVQVGAAAEAAPGAGDDHRPHRVVAGRGPEGCTHLPAQ